MGNRPVISKDQILGAAYEIATTQGLGALSIRAVATACGVAVGTVYNSYPTKSDLVNDVVGRFWQRALSGCMAMANGGEEAESANSSSPCSSAEFEHDDFVAFCRQLALERDPAICRK